jgi:predicted kinase
MSSQKPRVKIMRGLPGSGKTHWASSQDGACIVSADNYHMEDGKYSYKMQNAAHAHRMCFGDFIIKVENKFPLIIVDNTNTSAIEIAPYYRFAEVFHYDVEILHVNTPFEICLARQTHGVPMTTMLHMWKNLTFPLPLHWRMADIHP